MRIINVGSLYQIYPDDLKTFDRLPSEVYSVQFNPMQGFSLLKRKAVEVREKLYGAHNEKIEKTIKRFDHSERSLGVILSGKKGIGKTMFANILSEKMLEKDVPVIIVDRAYEGIADFLNSIEQEVMILFDEFEKKFPNTSERARELGLESQDALLGLFDGGSSQKRMYVITLNSLNLTSDYIINRPGRFHYHFRFDYPEPSEVKEYLEDNVLSDHHGEIEKAVHFSARVPLNYDCLRSIASELNFGSSFKEAVGDLNIVNVERLQYHFNAIFSNGIEANGILYLDPTSTSEAVSSYDLNCATEDWFEIVFDMTKLQFKDGLMVGNGSVVSRLEFSDEADDFKDGVEVSEISIKVIPNKAIGYNL